MKKFKRILRLCSLVLFMILAVAGIGIFGVAPILSKDRKLFPDITIHTENSDSEQGEKLSEEMQKT